MSFSNAVGGVREEGRDRSENDYYPTPPFATYALLKECRKDIPPIIWEPAAGRGWMAWELRRWNKTCKNGQDMIGSFASDKYVYENPITEVHQHDFLTQDQPYWTACMGIITNPPYRNNGAELFVRRAMKFNSPFTAILCRGTFFESAQRLNFFKYNPPSRILFFSRRFSCNEEYFVKEPLSGMVAYAWWIWNGQTRHGETKCSWIDTESVYNEWLQSCYLTGDDISKFITEKTKSRTIGLEAFLGTEPDAVEP